MTADYTGNCSKNASLSNFHQYLFDAKNEAYVMKPN